MKSRDALCRLKRFEVEEKRRKVAEIEAMISDFNQMAVDLERQIALEQERAGVTDVNHYAYPTFAKAAIQRRDNLRASAADLESKLQNAREALAEVDAELKRLELLDGRDPDRIKLEARSGDLAVAGGTLQHRAAS
jgi:flagellar FliJ protein